MACTNNEYLPTCTTKGSTPPSGRDPDSNLAERVGKSIETSALVDGVDAANGPQNREGKKFRTAGC